MKTSVVSVAAAALLLAACTTNPQTGQTDPNRTAIGAGIGALAGAGVGLLTADGDDGTDQRQRAMIGAGIGALAGAGAGLYMDRQAAALQQNLAGTGGSVTQQGDSVIVNLPGGVTFDTGSAAIRPQFYGPLNDVAATLIEFPQTTIDVIGHTDSVGDAGFNQRLSEERARSVAQYLMNQGVQPQRILTAGRGENQPIANNNTDAGRAQNRRVEIVLQPLTS